jgi:hypothetical protein
VSRNNIISQGSDIIVHPLLSGAGAAPAAGGAAAPGSPKNRPKLKIPKRRKVARRPFDEFFGPRSENVSLTDNPGWQRYDAKKAAANGGTLIGMTKI